MVGKLKRTATFEWNASTKFLENGKPVAASELKAGERATVNYARHGKQRVATRIAISPSAKRLRLTRLSLTKPRGTLDTAATLAPAGAPAPAGVTPPP